MIQTTFPEKHELVPSELRQSILQRDHYTCHECRQQLPETRLDIHHKIPVRKGGKHVPENLMTLCRKCHKTLEPTHSLKYAYPVSSQDGKVTIAVKKETIKYLQERGRYGDTYDSILTRLLTEYNNKEAST